MKMTLLSLPRHKVVQSLFKLVRSCSWLGQLVDIRARALSLHLNIMYVQWHVQYLEFANGKVMCCYSFALNNRKTSPS